MKFAVKLALSCLFALCAVFIYADPDETSITVQEAHVYERWQMQHFKALSLMSQEKAATQKLFSDNSCSRTPPNTPAETNQQPLIANAELILKLSVICEQERERSKALRARTKS